MNANPSTQTDWLAYLKRVLLIFLPLALLIGAGSFMIYRTEHRRQNSESAERGREAVRSSAAAISRSLEDISRDLLYLASEKEIDLYIGTGDPAHLVSLTEDWMTFSHTQMIYSQISWLHESGREMIRIDYAKPWPLPAPPEALRDRGRRYYFANTKKLNAGEIFVSKLELEMDNDHVKIPYTPTIRVSMPVYDKIGERHGIILLGYAAHDLLQRIDRLSPAGSNPTWMVNQDGYWLKGPSPADEWGFMFQRPDLTMKSRYPDAWQKISHANEGQFETVAGLWNFYTVYPLREVKHASASQQEAFSASMSENESAHYAWKLVSLLPASEYGNRMLPFALKLGASALLLLLLFFIGSWRMVRASMVEQATRRNLEQMVESRTRDLAESVRLEKALHASEMFARATIDALSAEICVLDECGTIVAVNQAWKEFSAENDFAHTFIGANYLAVCDRATGENSEEAADMAQGIRAVIAGTREDFTLEYPCHAPDQERWFRVGVTRYEGQVRQVVLAHENITERKKAEHQLQLAATVYKAIGEAIMVVDAENTILAINPAFTQFTGYAESEVVGRSTRLMRSEREQKDYYRSMWEQLEKTGHWQGKVWNRHKNGEERQHWLMIDTIYDEHGEVQQRICMYSPISDQKLAEQTIWQQANFDVLTGLPNRSMFHDRLLQEIKKAHRTNLPMALMFLDLDHFKDVNDTLGHNKGDLLLKEAARRLRSCVREGDTVARLGGDEFTIILSELEDTSNVERVALDILNKLSIPFALGEEMAYISASIGITLYPQDAQDINDLLKNADQAMYVSKNQGRNRSSYFTASMQLAAQNRMRMANDLRGALADGQFRVEYQPIVELGSGVIHKAEALLRWQHPRRGVVTPSEFISIAEETGMIIGISDWVFRQAAKQAAAWRQSHDIAFQISVNMSPVQFHSEVSSHGGWFDELKAMAQGGPQLDMEIVVEITESLLLDASKVVTDRLLAFRNAGIQLSLDDFGTGYSSLSYLKKFDIDYLKIDQSFVLNLKSESDDLALCEAMIVMAHKLGLKVIAEGVETREQCNLLARAGCDYGQGYLFSRPVPAEEFEALLERQSRAAASWR